LFSRNLETEGEVRMVPRRLFYICLCPCLPSRVLHFPWAPRRLPGIAKTGPLRHMGFAMKRVQPSQCLDRFMTQLGGDGCHIENRGRPWFEGFFPHVNVGMET
jgi:hypothetical protein